MKITCQSCQAKYTIADEKVAGKTVKIKCKKCGATIVVHGSDAAQGAPMSHPPPSGPAAHEEEHPTQIYGGAGGEAADEWTVNVTDDEQRTMTTAQIVSDFHAGVVTSDTYVWRDGMGDWAPLAEVPELMQLVGGAPVPAPPSSNRGVGATATMGSLSLGSPFGASAQLGGAGFGAPAASGGLGGPAAAARRAGARGGAVDLFGAAHLEERAAPQSSPPVDRQVGERNENSVLFSLSALTAAENAAKTSGPRDHGASFDLRPSPSSSSSNGRAGLDDIMNLGGGGMGAPMLAPPPLLAPVVEPPPVARPISIAPPGSMGAPFVGMPMQPKKSSPLGLVIGIVVGIGIAAAGAFFFMRPEAPPATGESGMASSTPSSAPTQAATASPTETVAAAPTETSAPTSAATGGTPAAQAAVRPGEKPGATRDKPEKDKKDEPTPPPSKPDKPEATAAPAAAAGAEFNRGAASSALGAAAGAAKGCKKPGGPTGSGRVRVTFAPSGSVTSAVVEGDLAGTSTGGCVASAFRSARVPPFEGAPVAVSKSFSIN